MAMRPFRSLPLLLAAASAQAMAAPSADQLNYAPPAAWVLPPPDTTPAAAPPDAPVRLVYRDQQVRIGPAGEETYTAYRARLLKPEALPMGNVAIVWNPSSGSATVHHLRIIRDGRVVDVLKDQRFKVIQREGNLEQSMLDGLLTATLQASGLQVGDELEFATTVVQRDPTLGDHAYGLASFPPQSLPGAFRFRMTWPDGRPVTWRATRDLPQAVPARSGGQTSVTYELRDPGSSIVNEEAPARYNIRRLIEFSDFASWTDLSRRFESLYASASNLGPNSPIRAEAKKIADAYPGSAERAQAALRLVQDQIRYVYVGLDGGNYRPATVEETWQRRFGDCKAKTVMLLALLRELRIEAEPVLVDAFGGDGTDARLPNPGVFNHVLVRARIDGQSYWLDGTRLGDRYLDRLPPPSFRWGLPLRAAGGDLEEIVPQPPKRPQMVGVVDIDARGGFEKPAIVKVQHVLRGNETTAMRMSLAALAAEDADRVLRAYWRKGIDWVEADRVAWRYDERGATLILSLEGEGKPDWDGNDAEGRDLTIVGAGFYPPPMRRRPREQDQSVPWLTKFPRFDCYATTIRLPAEDGKWRWTYRAAPMNQRLGGTAYWRASGLKGGIMRTIMSSRSEKHEISAEEALVANASIPGFDNKMSRVYQVAARSRAAPASAAESLPFGDDADWTGDVPLCSAPAVVPEIQPLARKD